MTLRASLCLLGLITMTESACTGCENDGVEIVVSGPHSVAVGDSIMLTAETHHGTDNKHLWTSGDETIATVTQDGRVTGAKAGETEIIATGDDTEQSTAHVMVVYGDGVASGTDTGDTGDASSSSSGEPGPGDVVPYYDEWLMSAHADKTSPAFNNWNDKGEIPTSCARCHSRDGFVDYLGGDGSEVAVVNQPAPTGSVVDCETCHNEAANELDWVQFDSGVTLTDLGPEARCMTCHQGRASTDSVNDVIASANVDDDTVSKELDFQNIHYYPAAATLWAGVVRGGYQYEDQVYDHRFRHAPGFDTCVGCHDQHTSKPRYDDCQFCHADALDSVGARDIRMIASLNVDYDGDGDTTVGIFFEVKGLEEKLYQAIQRYASGEVGQTICYAPHDHPYWFNSSTGAAAECTADDISGDNEYAEWTPRLLRATYNYQMSRKDPGAYVHNSRYIIKLLHDSITDINTVITNPVDMENAERDAPGHFNGAGKAARNWDDDEEVSENCSKCHSGAQGFRFYVEYGVGMTVPETSNGLECYTCHDSFDTTYDVIDIESTLYPSGIELEHDGFDNICTTCHSGREAKATVDAAIESGNLKFVNVHYKPAGAVRNGAESEGGYEYDGRLYSGFLHHDSRTQCTGCHDPVASNHTFRISDVWDSICSTCHSDQEGPLDVRLVHLEDYDGNGSTTDSLADELQGLSDRLLETIAVTAPSPICYDGDAYPYWLVPVTPSPLCGETSGSYTDWTPELMQATFNFHLHQVEKGAYAHNFEYMGQLLYDSIENLGGSVDDLVRP